MRKRIVVKSARTYEAKRNFTTKSGGGGYIMENNPLAKGKGGGG